MRSLALRTEHASAVLLRAIRHWTKRFRMHVHIALVSVTVVGACVQIASPAVGHAESAGALNGVYRASSLGAQAKTNGRYEPRETVRSTWTVQTTCSFADLCTGTVTSDQGWTAEVHNMSGQWFVKRRLPDWIVCPGGTANYSGLQIFKFYPVDGGGQAVRDSTTWAGWDETTGVSGACGRNLQTQITMPFRLDQIS